MKVTSTRVAFIWCFFFLADFALGGGLAYPQKDIEIFEKGGPLGRVTFSHQHHKMYQCIDCHPKVFQMEKGASGGGKPLSMREMMDAKFCGKCHDGQTAFSIITGKDCGKCHKFHPTTNCTKCHEPHKLTFEKAGPLGKVIFSHQDHMMNQCVDCHPKVFKMERPGSGEALSMREMRDEKYCGKCHDGKKAFSIRSEKDCARCHVPPKEGE